MLLHLLAGVALACGQTTHVWTVLHAVGHLPAGPLKDRLSAPDARRALISGAMFPDGGYSPVVQHPFGEASHWEPFQDHYLDFVKSKHPDDVRYEAFLYGLAGHGLGDQLYDAAYLSRSGEGQPDQDTDVVIASLWGGHAPNDHFVPYDELVPLFADAGVPVDVGTLEDGMASLDFAVALVGLWGADPAQVAKARANAPWATSHLEDRSIPGAPVCLGETLAQYWQVLERRLAGEAPADLILTSFPAPGGFAHPREGTAALISVVFARALVEASIEAPGRVVLEGPDGVVPATAWMYYREASNVLNVQPEAMLAEDTVYTLSILPGVESIGGDLLATTWTTSFSTGQAPTAPVARPEERGCDTGGGAGWALVAAALARRRRR